MCVLFRPLSLPPSRLLSLSHACALQNQYARFTDLAATLHGKGITHLTVVGLALDYCVKCTIIDAVKLGFQVELVRAGSRAVGGERKADEVCDDLSALGVSIV